MCCCFLDLYFYVLFLNTIMTYHQQQHHHHQNETKSFQLKKKIQTNKQEKNESTIWEKKCYRKSFSFDEHEWKLKQIIQTKSRWIHCNDFTTWTSFPVICTVIGSLNNTSFLCTMIHYRRQKSNNNSFFIRHLHFLRYMQRDKEYIKKKTV